MVTKLKNYSYSGWLKVTAALLLCACVFGCAYNCMALLFTSSYYGFVSFSGGTIQPEKFVQPVTFEDSRLFSAQLQKLFYQLKLMDQFFISEEKMKNGEAFAAYQERLTNEMIENLEIVEEGVYGDGSDAFYCVAIRQQTDIKAIIETNGGDLWFSSNREAAIADIKAYVQDQQPVFYTEYEKTKLYLQSVTGLQYALVNNADGRIYSNMREADAEKPDAKALERAVRELPWYVIEPNRGIAKHSRNYPVQYHDWFRVPMWSYDNIPWEELGPQADPSALYRNVIARNLTKPGYDLYLGYQKPSGSGDPRGESAEPFDSLYPAYLEHAINVPVQLTLAVLFAALTLFLTLFLLAVAGKRKTTDGKRSWLNRIYLELHAPILAGAILLGITGIVLLAEDWTLSSAQFSRMTFLPISLLCAAMYALLLQFTCSVVGHIRNKTLLHYLMLGRAARWLLRQMKKPFANGMRYAAASTVIFLFIAAFALTFFVLGLLFTEMSYGMDGFVVFFAFVFATAVLLYALRCVISLRSIMRAASKMREGDLAVRLPRSGIAVPLRRMARDLMSLQEGMRSAVNTALRDQRMKTELITNVSHDLKTPLTSIINYVDLLKRCDIPDESAQGYLQVLDEKSARMKTLVEDLVEVSKATSGAVELQLMHLSLNELALQAAGEYNDVLAEQQLELRFQEADSPVTVLADNQKTWRIVENLLQNARKYALPGTRVFLRVFTDGNYGVLSLKNVSCYPIDVPAEELTQRFVRADSSRGGEGSGLGLSIAKGLCELQGGELLVHVDSDMFTAIIRLPLVLKQAEQNSPEKPLYAPDRLAQVKQETFPDRPRPYTSVIPPESLPLENRNSSPAEHEGEWPPPEWKREKREKRKKK